MRDTDPQHDDAGADEDPLLRLFAPIRTPTSSSDARVRAIRTAAERRSDHPSVSSRLGRGVAGRRPAHRLALAGAGGLAVVAAAGGIAAAVDHERPGTFVGEAGARELLRSAAAETREQPAVAGWTLTATRISDRAGYVGRRCGTCATERGVLENRWVRRTWNGPDGELYTSVAFEPGTAVENAELLRAVDVAGHRLMPDSASHRAPGAGTADAPDVALLLQDRRTLADPAVVPDEPGALVRWVTEQRDRRRSADVVVDGKRLAPPRIVDDATDVSWELVDLATSSQLTGRQRAAAFEALSTRSGVAVVPTPAALAGPGRVAVRIAAVSGAGADVPDPSELDRFVVFDGGTGRLVGEYTPPQDGGPSSAPEHEGADGARVRTLVGSAGSERVFDTPVPVSGPGLDADGRRLLELSDAREIRPVQPSSVSTIR